MRKGKEMSDAQRGKAAARLFIGNPGCTETALRAAFEQYGPINSFNILKDFSFVQFESSTDAKTAVAAVNGTSVDGVSGPIRVEVSRVNSKELKSCLPKIVTGRRPSVKTIDVSDWPRHMHRICMGRRPRQHQTFVANNGLKLHVA